MITKENIFEEAKKSNLEVFKSDLVDKVKDANGLTPLHWLAWNGVKEILDHSSVDKVKDGAGWTPLHDLASRGVKEILSHLSVDKVKDIRGDTPLYRLAMNGYLTKEDLRKKYPWYKKEIKNILTAIKEIEDTSRSIQFILEDS